MDQQRLLVFDPLCYDVSSVEKSLRDKFYNYEKIVEYPFENRKAIFNPQNMQISWKSYTKPQKYDNLLDVGNWDDRERDVKKIIQNCNNILKLDNDFEIIPVEKKEEIIECDYNNTLPLVFSITNYQIGGISQTQKFLDLIYFDDNFTRNHKVLYYEKTSHDDSNIHHSGDWRISNEKLYQSLTIKNKNKPAEGIISFQGYDHQSLIKLSNCDPNLCITDGPSRVYIIHCPLIPNYVKNNHIVHLAAFKYNPQTKKILWKIPKSPVFDNIKINVGSEIKYYGEKFEQFKTIVKTLHQQQQTLHQQQQSRSFTTIAPLHFAQRKGNDGGYIAIIQEPLIPKALKINYIKKILNSVDKVYKFHQSIKQFNMNKECVAYYDINMCKYSLPIAGGSIISDHPIIETGLPIESKELAKEYESDINNARGVIVILTDTLSTNNVPTVHKKLNACYIIIPEKNSTDLNDIDTSLAIAQQGPLSATVVYRNEALYFYRGILNNDKYNFNDEIIDDNVIITDRLPFTSFSVVYNNEKREIFQIENENDDEYILSCIMKAQNDNLPLKPIFSQLEIILKPEIFSKMMDKIVERSNYVFTRKDAIQCLSNSNSNLQQYLMQRYSTTADKIPYTKNWFISSFSEYMNLDKTNAVIKYQNEINIILKNSIAVAKREKEAKYEILADLLQNCVSTRASYGLRRKGLNHMVKRKRIYDNVNIVHSATEDTIYELFENECTEDGVLIFTVNKKNYELNRHDRLLAIQGDLAGSFTSDNPSLLSFTFSTEGKNYTMIIIPMLKKIAEAMNNPRTFPWRHVESGGAIEFIRIALRRTVHQTLFNQEMRDQYKESSAIVGKTVIKILLSALGNLEKFQPSSIKDGVIQQMRNIMGLILSMMASGTDAPLYPIYQTLLYNDYHNIKFNFQDDRWLINSLIPLWPKLYLPSITLKQNAIGYITQKLETRVNMRKKKKDLVQIKAKWMREVIQPIVVTILSKVIMTDEEISYYVDVGNDVEKIELQFEVCASKDETRHRSTSIINTYDDDASIIEQVNNIYADAQYNDKMMKAFTLLQNLKSFNECDSRENKIKFWNRVRSVAFDYYMKYSNTFVQSAKYISDIINLKPFNIDIIRNFRAVIFERILRFRNPFYVHTRIPNVFWALSKCQSMTDYSKVYNAELKQYIKDNNGDFLKKHIRENENDFDEEYNIIVDDKDIEMAKWLNFQHGYKSFYLNPLTQYVLQVNENNEKMAAQQQIMDMDVS